MVSVPSQRYRFIPKFRPCHELDQLEVHQRRDKKIYAVMWVCYKALKIRWRKLRRQLTRSKNPGAYTK